MSSNAPCGGVKASVSTGLSIWSTIGLILGIIFGSMGLAGVLHLAGFGSLLKLLLLGAIPANVTSSMLAAYFAVFLAAFITAAAIIAWEWSNYSSLSSAPPVGVLGCVAGVIDQIQGPNLAPFSEAHGFIQVVVKQTYWSVVTAGNPPYVWCENCENCPPSDWPSGTTQANANSVGCSPMLPCVYYSQAVVDAALGEAIGATVGAAVGAVLGTLAGIAAMGALGCAATAVFVAICLLVLLLAIIIAVAVVAIVAAVGAALGNTIGATAAGDPAIAPGGNPPATSLPLGTYVMVTGNLVQDQNFAGSNAIVYAGWIPDSSNDTVVNQTQTNGNGTTVFGISQGIAPFCYTDPDANIQGDPCQAQSSGG